MVEIIAEENCGNAPRQKYILDFLVAVANMDIETAMEMLADTIELEIVGRTKISGKESARALLLKDGSPTAVETLEIFNIISHGKACAANGVWHFADGSKVAFNTMYLFDGFGKNSQLKKIQTYSIIL